MTDLDAAMDAFKPDLIDRYESMITGQFERMVKVHGPALKDISGSWTFCRTYSNLVQPVLVRAVDPVTKRTVACHIDPIKLRNFAKRNADTAIAEWKGKIVAKMGEMQDAKVNRLDGVSFAITGSKGSVPVSIHQQMIVNVSAKGTVFNQFPARIYRDGKAISAAKFKTL